MIFVHQLRQKIQRTQICAKLTESKHDKSSKELNKNENISIVQTCKEFFSKKLFEDIKKNFHKQANRKRYSNEFVDWSYLIKYGQDQYGQLKTFFPFPCTKALRARNE